MSTETDARLSFDTEALIEKGRTLIKIYEEHGTPRERILIKIASTWEGIRAAEVLTKEGIHCNLTLLFSTVQAAACAEAGVQLISPFVGRIYDWFKKANNRDYTGAEDPRRAVEPTKIYEYYKKFGYATEVMGASFRNTSQIAELAGCDLLTISPKLLKELAESEQPLERKLDPEKAKASDIEKVANGRKELPFPAQRGRDGHRENGGTASVVRGGHPQGGQAHRREGRRVRAAPGCRRRRRCKNNGRGWLSEPSQNCLESCVRRHVPAGYCLGYQRKEVSGWLGEPSLPLLTLFSTGVDERRPCRTGIGCQSMSSRLDIGQPPPMSQSSVRSKKGDAVHVLIKATNVSVELA